MACVMIIDEVQRAPELLLAVKNNVDINQYPGRFLLTGSANIQLLPGVTESLAGRVRKIGDGMWAVPINSYISYI